MRKYNARNYYIRNVNTHLLNVLEESYYIEIGTASLYTLTKLLNGTLLDLQEIINFDLLNEGIGKITNDSNVDVNYQLNYLLSYRQKSSTHKFFLTIGLLKYRDDNGLEKYAPIVLIPIDIDYQKGKIRLSSEPIPNRLLLRLLVKLKFNTQEEQRKYVDNAMLTKLTTINAIDKFCQDLSEVFSMDISPLNYLTVCNVEYFDFDLRSDLFDSERSVFEVNETKLYNEYFSKICAILPTNLHQKHSLLRAHNGESFAVDGKLGSGKTYTILNIIADFIKRDKKVLYVNQDLDNIWEIERNIRYFELDNIMVNLTTKTTDIDISPVIFKQDEVNKFSYEPIKFFEKFQEQRYKRIYGFTFDQLTEELAILKRKHKELPKIKIETKLDQNEYFAIKKALVTIEDNLKVITDFSDSVWKDLQAGEGKISASEISERTSNFYNTNYQLYEEVKKYCKKYKIKEPTNIHDLNNLIVHVFRFDVAKPQVSWKTKEDRIRTKQALVEIQEAIDLNYTLQDYYKANVSSKYLPGTMLDILTEILKDHLSITDDHEYINNLLKNDTSLDQLINSISDNINKSVVLYKQFNSYFGFLQNSDVTFEFIKDTLTLLRDNMLPKELMSLYVSHPKKALQIYADIHTNYLKILELKEKLKKYLLINVRFGYLEILEIFKFQDIKKQLSRYFDLFKMKKMKVEKEIVISLLHEYYETGNKIKEQLNFENGKAEFEKYWEECSNFYKYISKNSKFEKNIIYFASKQVSPNPYSINKVVSVLTELVKEITITKNNIESLKIYKINIEEQLPIKQLNGLSYWISYLVKVVNLRKQVYEYIKKKTITIDDVIRLVDNDNEYINLLNKMEEKEQEYILLLGNNYNKFDTVISDTGSSIDHFDDFMDRLINPDDVDKLLRTKVFENFLKDTNQIHLLYTKWFKEYRQFSNCFIRGQSACQYSNFDNVLNILNNFKERIDQITKVTEILNALSKIKSYKLNNIVNKIYSGVLKEDIVDAFTFALFSSYIQYFDKNSRILLDFNWIKSQFEEFEKNEQNYCINNIIELKKIISKKGKPKAQNIPFYAYNKQVSNSIKYNNLFLADLNIFNSDFDVSKFDLVLIDDCHLSSANKYDPINHCKQVILFGDKSFKSSVSNTLLQRIGDAPINQYLNRYVKMSPKFNNIWTNNNRYIYSKETTIKTHSVNSIQEFAYSIVDYFTKNNNLVFDIVIGNEFTKRELYTAIVELLNMSYSAMEIIKILSYNIKLINANEDGSRYVNDVFIFYTDFIEYDLSAKNLIFKNFVVVENSVQIYYLSTKSDSTNKEILADIHKTIASSSVKPKYLDGIAKLFLADLQVRNVKATAGFGKLDIIVQLDNKKSFAIIFEGTASNASTSLIDDYHYYYRQYVDRGWNIKIIYSYDLIDNYDNILSNTIQEIEGVEE